MQLQALLRKPPPKNHKKRTQLRNLQVRVQQKIKKVQEKKALEKVVKRVQLNDLKYFSIIRNLYNSFC